MRGFSKRAIKDNLERAMRDETNNQAEQIADNMREEARGRWDHMYGATCSTCGNSYDPDDIRGTHPYRHPVDGVVGSKAAQDGSQEPKAVDPEVQVKSLPSDPLLRHILIEQGIISVQDIIEAEQKLAASGLLTSEEPNRG